MIMCCIYACQLFLQMHMQNVLSSGEVPVYKLVLLQILAALSDISGHVEKVHHGQARWVLLIKDIRDRESPRIAY